MNNEARSTEPIEIYLTGNVASIRRMSYILLAYPIVAIVALPIWFYIMPALYGMDAADTLELIETIPTVSKFAYLGVFICATIFTLLTKRKNDETIYIIENRIPVMKVYNDRLLLMNERGLFRRVDLKLLDKAYRAIPFSEISYFETKEEEKGSGRYRSTYDVLCNAGKPLYRIYEPMSVSVPELLVLLNTKHEAYEQMNGESVK